LAARRRAALIDWPAVKTAIALMLVAGVLAAGCSRKTRTVAPGPLFTDLSPEEVGRLDKRRAVIQDVITQRYQAPPLTRTKADLPVLQRLLDDGVFARSQTYQLQSLGVVFGDVLATELPLWWMLATDQGDSWPTLRLRDTTVQVNARTMISKRIESGEKVDLAALLRATGDSVGKLERDLRR
jgi:hypothetical protein